MTIVTISRERVSSYHPTVYNVFIRVSTNFFFLYEACLRPDTRSILCSDLNITNQSHFTHYAARIVYISIFKQNSDQ